MILADAEEHRIEREQDAERERLAEERHQRAMTLAVAQAEGRGEYVSPLAIATGQVQGRTFGQIFAAAAEAGDREDQIAAARANRESGLTHVEFGEPRILTAAAPASSTGRKIATRARKFWDVLDARRKLAAAEAAAQASANDFGFVCERRPREDPVVAVPLSSRDGDGLAGYRVSYR
jgi:hypothetical protein